MVRIIGNFSYNAHTEALLSKFNIHEINEMYNNILLCKHYSECKRNTTELSSTLSTTCTWTCHKTTRAVEGSMFRTNYGLQLLKYILPTVLKLSSVLSIDYVAFHLVTSNRWLFSILSFGWIFFSSFFSWFAKLFTITGAFCFLTVCCWACASGPQHYVNLLLCLLRYYV